MQVWQSFLNGYFNKSGARRVPQVDSLRGVAALLIFFVHYHALMSHWLVAGSGAASFAKLLESIAHSGTDLFFTLSGYLIYGSLMRREQRIGPYLLRRFGRIYPTFLFVVGGYLLIFAFDPAVSKLPADPFYAALYVLANLLLDAADRFGEFASVVGCGHARIRHPFGSGSPRCAAARLRLRAGVDDR